MFLVERFQAARAERHPRRSHCTPWWRTSKAPASLRSKSARVSSRATNVRARAKGSLPAVTGPGRVAHGLVLVAVRVAEEVRRHAGLGGDRRAGLGQLARDRVRGQARQMR